MWTSGNGDKVLPSLVDCWVNIGETSNVVYNKNTALEVWLSETEKTICQKRWLFWNSRRVFAGTHIGSMGDVRNILWEAVAEFMDSGLDLNGTMRPARCCVCGSSCRLSSGLWYSLGSELLESIALRASTCIIRFDRHNGIREKQNRNGKGIERHAELQKKYAWFIFISNLSLCFAQLFVVFYSRDNCGSGGILFVLFSAFCWLSTTKYWCVTGRFALFRAKPW